MNITKFLASFVLSNSLKLLGIDYEMLRAELLRGMRLSHPILATHNVSHILQICWLAEPDKRPPFSKVKTLLYEDEKFPKKLVEDGKEGVSMRSQYKSIQNCNPMYVHRNNNDVSSQRNKTIPEYSSGDITVYPEEPRSIREGTTSSDNSSHKMIGTYIIPRKTQSTTSREQITSTNYISVHTTVTSCGGDDYIEPNVVQLEYDKGDVSDK